MVDSGFESNVNLVREMILDEQKIVTYLSVSRDLCIHVNESKKILNHIVEEMQQKSKILNINYLISGLSEDGKGYTKLCSMDEVSEKREMLSVIFFSHIYSVSVGSSKVDNVAYMALSKFEDFPLCPGLIKNNVCIKRSTQDIGLLIRNSQNNDMKLENKSVQKPVHIKIKEEKKSLSNVSIDTQSNNNHKPVEIKKEISPPNNSNNQDKKSTKANKGIALFFNKSSKTQETRENGMRHDVKTEKQDDQAVTNSVSNGYKMEVDKEPDEGIHNGNDQVVCKKSSLEKIKKNAKVDKKRKRVLHVSDTESEEEREPVEPDINHDSEDEIPATPSIKTVKITSGIVNPKKKRKIVDKTYTDEEGYILTKKVEVYESCSDNDEEVDTKENATNFNSNPTKQTKLEVSPKQKKAPAKTKKISSPQKGKQPTLMNFFKKK